MSDVQSVPFSKKKKIYIKIGKFIFTIFFVSLGTSLTAKCRDLLSKFFICTEKENFNKLMLCSNLDVRIF